MVESAESATLPTRAEAPAVQIADLAIDLPIAGLPDAPRPLVRGLRLTVEAQAVQIALTQASTVLSQLSRSRIDDLLDQLADSVWARPLRSTYALFFRLAGVENGLEIDGGLAAGAILARARFRSDPDAGLFGQLRDRAKGAASVRLRVEPSVGDAGRLRLRLAVEPDVRGLVTKAVVGTLAGRPGVTRFDDATVEVDLGVALAAEATVPVTWEAAVRSVRVTPEALTIVFGSAAPGTVE